MKHFRVSHLPRLAKSIYGLYAWQGLRIAESQWAAYLFEQEMAQSDERAFLREEVLFGTSQCLDHLDDRLFRFPVRGTRGQNGPTKNGE